MSNYDDIINLAHYEPKHPRMDAISRAAQFAPFDALTGYGEEISETARRTDRKISLDENELSVLDSKLQIISMHKEENPLIEITYFIKDDKKEGGVYETIQGTIKKIDYNNSIIILKDNTRIPIDNILDINSDLIKNIE